MAGVVAGEENPNPIMVTQNTSITVNYRVAEYFLCPQCEDRLNKGGENWTLKNSYRGASDFPIQDALLRADSKHVLGQLQKARMFDARSMATINLPRLVDFATAIFWKASARKWKALDHSTQLEFGPYEHKFRDFLLGNGPFPNRAALLISVSGDPKPDVVSIYPYGGKTLRGMNGVRQYRFAIPGMAFWLHIGNIPAVLRAACAHHSGTLFLASNLNEMFMRDATSLFAVLDKNRNKPVR